MPLRTTVGANTQHTISDEKIPYLSSGGRRSFPPRATLWEDAAIVHVTSERTQCSAGCKRIQRARHSHDSWRHKVDRYADCKGDAPFWGAAFLGQQKGPGSCCAQPSIMP